jgi:hypothetical protein
MIVVHIHQQARSGTAFEYTICYTLHEDPNSHCDGYAGAADTVQKLNMQA